MPVHIFGIFCSAAQYFLLSAEQQRHRMCASGLIGKDAAPERIIKIDVSRQFRTRTNKRHIATHDIPESRYLVDPRSTEKSTNGENTSISMRCDRSGFVRRMHGSQLVNNKAPTTY